MIQLYTNSTITGDTALNKKKQIFGIQATMI